jgi:hypothetical protein
VAVFPDRCLCRFATCRRLLILVLALFVRVVLLCLFRRSFLVFLSFMSLVIEKVLEVEYPIVISSTVSR